MQAPWPGAVLVAGGFGPQWMDRESVDHLRRQGIAVEEVRETAGEDVRVPTPALECYVSEPETVAPPVKRGPGRPRKVEPGRAV